MIESSRAGRTTTYVLDANGNRTEKRVSSGGDTTVETYSYNQRDQLQQVEIDGVVDVEYTYDANGNRIAATRQGVTREFNFSSRNRLLSLNLQGAPPEIEWRYDDAGFRIEQTTPTEARRFHWDGDRLRLETNVLGNALIQFLHGPDRLLSETEGSATRNWLTDGMRTPVKRLNDGGSVYGFTFYDEFGLVEEENNPDTPRFGFTGHQRGPEQEPELYYAQQRWYNAGAGRFLSHDPLWGELTQPMSRHRYLYAYANPTVYWDPDGRFNARIEQSIKSRMPSGARAELERQELAQADITYGAGEAAVQTAIGAVQLGYQVYGAGLESLGVADFGSTEHLNAVGAQLAEGAKQLINDPEEAVFGAIYRREQEIAALEAEGNGRAANRARGALFFDLGSTATGLGGLGRAGISAAAKASSRVGRDAPNPSRVAESGDNDQFVSLLDEPGEFETLGFPSKTPGMDVLTDTLEGRLLVQQYRRGGMTPAMASRFASRDITSGSSVPIAKLQKQGDVFVRAVPSGNSPGRSSYYLSPDQYSELQRNGTDVFNDLSLPDSSYSDAYDIYQYSVRTGAAPISFTSEIAPSVSGARGVRTGRFQQTIIPNSNAMKLDGILESVERKR